MPPNVPTSRTIVDADGNFLVIDAVSGGVKVKITDPIVIGTVTVSVDVTGDTIATQNAGDSYRTNPKAGEVWPVSVQSGGGSGDTAIVDGADRSLKASVRNYTPAKAVATAHTPSGDRTYWNEVIDITVAGDNTIHTPATGKAFYIDSIVMVNAQSGELYFKSGTTPITGPMNFAGNGRMIIDHSSFDERAKLRGRAINDILVINTAAAIDVGGYVTGYDQ